MKGSFAAFFRSIGRMIAGKCEKIHLPTKGFPLPLALTQGFR